MAKKMDGLIVGSQGAMIVDDEGKDAKIIHIVPRHLTVVDFKSNPDHPKIFLQPEKQPWMDSANAKKPEDLQKEVFYPDDMGYDEATKLIKIFVADQFEKDPTTDDITTSSGEFKITAVEGNKEEVDCRYYPDSASFQRIRRITGYLVGTLDRFNNAKRSEVEDRVKHFDMNKNKPTEPVAEPKEDDAQMGITDQVQAMLDERYLSEMEKSESLNFKFKTNTDTIDPPPSLQSPRKDGIEK
jgi:hypothetical protein